MPMNKQRKEGGEKKIHTDRVTGCADDLEGAEEEGGHGRDKVPNCTIISGGQSTESGKRK
jgi:hypothetical protein